MAFYNAIIREYSPESGRSEICGKVWICSLDDFEKIPKSWFLRFNGKLINKKDLRKELLVKFTLITPVHIYIRSRKSATFPVVVNLEFFGNRTSRKNINEICLDVQNKDTVEVVKFKIEMSSGIVSQQQRLIYAGAQLNDKKTVKDYGIRMEEVIHVVDEMKKGVVEESEASDEPGHCCVSCDRKRPGIDVFVVDCGHFYHACCIPGGGKGCVICESEVLVWSEALELYSDEVSMPQPDKTGFRLRKVPQLLDDDEIEEAKEATEDVVNVSRFTLKLKEVDEYYWWIAAILIPGLVYVKLGGLWAAVVFLTLVELMRRRNQEDTP